MESVELKAIREWAEKYIVAARPNNDIFNRTVHLVTDDGAVFIYQNAFVIKRMDWYIIFPEHQNIHCQHDGDVAFIYQYQNIPIALVTEA